MALKASTAVRNAMLDAFEAAIGASPVLKLRSGAPPAAAASADTGTVIATINLGADWMANASGGSKGFSSTPLQDLAADAQGVIGHFRLYANDGVTCHYQGTVAEAGGDMTVDNATVNAGQQINVTAWTVAMTALA
jgi:hypothetical protein